LAQLAIAEDPERALLLGLAAVDATDEPIAEAVSALHQAMQSMRVTRTMEGVVSRAVVDSSDGSLLAVDRLDEHGYAIVDASDATVVAEVATPYPPGDFGLAFASDDTTLAVVYANRGQEDSTTGASDAIPAAQLFSVPDGRVLTSLAGPEGDYVDATRDATDRWLAALHIDPEDAWQVVAWDLQAGGPPIWRAPGIAVRSLPGTESVLVLGSAGDRIDTIDLATGTVVASVDLGEPNTYTSMAVAPSGRLVALTSFVGRRVDVVEMASGDVAASLPMPSPGSSAFSRDGRQLAVAGNDNLIRVFDTSTFTERQLAGSPAQPFGLTFAPDGRGLVSATVGELQFWDLTPAGPSSLGNFQIPAAAGFTGRFVISADESQSLVAAYTAESGSLHHIDIATGAHREIVGDVRRHNPNGPTVSRESSIVAAMDAEYRTRLYDLATGTALKTLERCETVRGLDPSGRFALIDGRQLCETYFQSPPLPGPGVDSRVVDLETGRTVLNLGETAILDTWHAFGPPGADGVPSVVAVMEYGVGAVTVYDLASGEALNTYTPERNDVLSVALSSDGSHLAVGTEGGNVTVLDVAELGRVEDARDAVLWTASAHAGSVQGLAVSTEGWVASASSSGDMQVWSLTGDVIAEVPLDVDDPPYVDFAADTSSLYYEDGDGVIRKFMVDTADTVRLARSMLTRGFTDDECARYFAGQRCPAAEE
jgi:WD40 repeat protein